MDIKIESRQVSEEFKIPEFNLNSFLSKVRILQNKLKKQNLEDLKVEIGKGFLEKLYSPELDSNIEITFFKIKVSGPSFHIPGRKLIAIISKRDEKIELTYSSPDFKLAHVENLPKNLKCERCQKNRQRIHFTLLENTETGATEILGKECADDFYDKNLVKSFLFTETLMRLKEDEEVVDFHMPKENSIYLVEHFIAHSIDSYVSDGFAPKSELANSTLEKTKHLYSTKRPKQEYLAMAREFLADPMKTINHRSFGNDSIRFQVKNAISEEFCEERYCSFLVLIAPALLKIKNMVNEKEDVEISDKGFFGAIGDKAEIKIVIESKQSRPSNYHRGDDWSIIAKTADGHNLLIPGNSFFPAIGAEITVKGTIKQHFMMGGKRFTKLVRVKTQKCERSLKFAILLADLFEAAVIKNEEDYWALFESIQSLQEQYHLSSMAHLLKNYQILKENRPQSVINCGGYTNNHSSFEFGIGEFVEIKLDENSPEDIRFKVKRNFI